MADKSSATVVISENEQERVRKLGIAFRDQLRTWMAGVAAGVTYSPAVARVLAESLFELGIVAFMTSAGQFSGLGLELTADDDKDAERAEMIFAKLMIVIEAEVAS